MSNIFKIPPTLSAHSLSGVYLKYVELHNNIVPSKVVFDFTKLTFATPTGIVFLGNIIDFIVKIGSEISVIQSQNLNSAMQYLYDSQFFRDHFNLPSKVNNLRSTTFSLTRMAAHQSPQWLENYFMPWIENACSKNPESLYSLQSSVSELFNNIDNHTEMDIGFIFAQHYPKKREIKIAIGDFGVGIPAKVRSDILYSKLNDYDAIVKATEEGFSTKSTPQNRGRGLDQLLRSVVIGYKGKVTFYSGEGAVCFYNLNGNVANEKINHLGYCGGTTIEIFIQPDNIIQYENEEEVIW